VTPARPHAPLLPVALAATAGVTLDRFLGVPPITALAGALVAVAVWAALAKRRPAVSLAALWVGFAAAGAAWHFAQCRFVPADDISHATAADPRLVRLRGTLADEPTALSPSPSPLASRPAGDTTVARLQVALLETDAGWQPVSGLVALTVAGRVNGVHVGDAAEVFGWLSRPEGPSNPGERDRAAWLADQGVRAELHVRESPEPLTRLAIAGPPRLDATLAAVRGWARRRLAERLPEPQAGLAAALLLGDTTALATDDWQRYVRTGVVHALAVSGQHLVVLAGFAWVVLRLAGVRRAPGAAAVAVGLVAYALLTGMRPPVLRAAVVVVAACGAIVLRRPALPLNLLALAWLTVLCVNPADLFGPGCQLSFLAVAVLGWGAGLLPPREPPTPLEQLIDESRPPWLRGLRRAGGVIASAYLANVAVTLAVTPLVAGWYGLVTPAALVIGPPVVLLTSVALVSGFLLLMTEVLGGVAAAPLAWVTGQALAGCDALVTWADGWPSWAGLGGFVPAWWAVVFYAGLLTVLLAEPTAALRRRAVVAGLAWACLGLAAAEARPLSGGLRCTFLAVGHGGCVVIESPDGRVLLYDAGSLAGPDVTRRVIAPFLAWRGVRRIDEVFLSHADLDHFNGLPALLRRFAVGRVTATPSFADKPTPGVRATLAELARYGVALRTAVAGDRLTAGDLTLEVLHPPPVGPAGGENVRSLVLLLRHGRTSVLLTGDLEGPGMAAVRARPAPAIDVLLAPHHGSRAANTAAFADWARPRLVIAGQGRPVRPMPPLPYAERGVPVLGTWPHGAVTLTGDGHTLSVETFRSRQRLTLRIG
jgi:competence protein ComEC